jgi:hypothetical protein
LPTFFEAGESGRDLNAKRGSKCRIRSIMLECEKKKVLLERLWPRSHCPYQKKWLNNLCLGPESNELRLHNLHAVAVCQQINNCFQMRTLRHRGFSGHHRFGICLHVPECEG